MSKTVKVEGRLITVPDDATPDEIDEISQQKTSPQEVSQPKKVNQQEPKRTMRDFVTSPNGFIRQGLGRAGQGIKDAYNTPGLDSKLHGASEVIRGVGTAAIPAMIPLAVANPISAAAGLATGTAGQYLGEKGGEALGMSPGASELTGDVAGILSGGGVGKRVSEMNPNFKMRDLAKIKPPSISTVGHSVGSVINPFSTYHKTLAAKGVSDMFGGVRDAVSNRRNLDLDARLRGFGPSSGKLETPPEATYSDQPLSGYRPDIQSPDQNSPKLPSWMSENVEPMTPDPTHGSYKDIKNPPVDNGFNGEGMRQIEPQSTDFAPQSPKLPQSGNPLKGKKTPSKAYKEVKKAKDIVPETPVQESAGNPAVEMPPGNAQPTQAEPLATPGTQGPGMPSEAPQPVASGSYRMIFDENGQPLAYDDPTNPYSTNEGSVNDVTGSRNRPDSNGEMFRPGTSVGEASPDLMERLGLRRYDEEFPTPAKQVIPKKKKN